MESPKDKFLSYVEFIAREKIEPRYFSHHHYDGKDIWFCNYPLGNLKPVENQTLGEEMVILDFLGSKNGLELVHPSPRETMEIILAENGRSFLENVLYRKRVNNGIIVEKNKNGFVARNVNSVRVDDRVVPAESIIVDENNVLSGDDRPEGVKIIYKTDESQLFEKVEEEAYFRKGFSGKLIPSKIDLKTHLDFCYMNSKEAEQHIGRFTVFDYSDKDKDGKSVISSCFEPPFKLGTFPFRTESYMISNIIPLFTRSNPKK